MRKLEWGRWKAGLGISDLEMMGHSGRAWGIAQRAKRSGGVRKHGLKIDGRIILNHKI